MGHQDRQAGMAESKARDTAQKRLAIARMAIAAHYEDVRADQARDIEERGSDAAESALLGHCLRRNAVPSKISDHVRNVGRLAGDLFCNVENDRAGLLFS